MIFNNSRIMKSMMSSRTMLNKKYSYGEVKMNKNKINYFIIIVFIKI